MIVHDLYKQIEAAKGKIDEIQKECNHPTAARISTPKTISRQVYEDDEYGGGYVTRNETGSREKCGLCCAEWTEAANGEVYNEFSFR